MAVRVLALVLSVVLVFSFVSLAMGFGSDANKVNPNKEDSKDQRPYTPENATKPYDEAKEGWDAHRFSQYCNVWTYIYIISGNNPMEETR
jgi:hypothetical protein